MKFIKVNDFQKDVSVIPCPFCGEKEEICFEEYEREVGTRWRIVCASCMASIDRGYDQTPQPLLEEWNKRVSNENND